MVTRPPGTHFRSGAGQPSVWRIGEGSFSFPSQNAPLPFACDVIGACYVMSILTALYKAVSGWRSSRRQLPLARAASLLREAPGG